MSYEQIVELPMSASGGHKVKVKYEGVLYNTASFGTLPSPVTAPHTVHRQ